jgi:hypothetical protein
MDVDGADGVVGKELCLVSWRLCPAVAAILKVAALDGGTGHWCRRQGGFAAAVAQLVERVLGKDEVMGSSPISSSW